MRAVAVGKAQGGPGRHAFAQAQHFEQLAHFVLQHQLASQRPLGQGEGIGFCGEPAVQQKVPLAGVAQDVKARVLRGDGAAGEIDVGGDVFAAHVGQRVAVHFVALVADQGAHGALGVVVLVFAKTVVNEKRRTAL